MATLTANVPRLPEHCPHKLPTSCRLTAMPSCCACQDRRAHSSFYSKYIDGVGFVLRGTRQERYCWMCKEFWNARVAAANIRQCDTQIPQVPDQTEFLEQWYDWHRGFRILRHDGTEEHELLVGERLEDVAPGHLPRTLEELQAGTSGELAAERAMPSNFVERISNPVTAQTIATEIDPEDRIFDEPASPLPARTHIDRPREAEQQARRVAALRRELHRMRIGLERIISGLQELGELYPDSEDDIHRSELLDLRLQTLESQISSNQGLTVQPANDALVLSRALGSPRETRRPSAPSGMPINNTFRSSRATNHDQNLQELRTRLSIAVVQENALSVVHGDASHTLECAKENLRAATVRRESLEREIRVSEQDVAFYGSREDVERQGPDYESFFRGMSSIWGDRYRTMEEESRRHRLEMSSQEALSHMYGGHHGHSHDMGHDDVAEANQALQAELGGPSDTGRRSGVMFRSSPPRAENWRSTTQVSVPVPRWRTNQTHDMTVSGGAPPSARRLERLRDPWRVQRQALGYGEFYTGSDEEYEYEDEDGSTEEEPTGLDQDGRPAPVDDKDLMVKMECKICYGQLASVAVLPCGHCVMCEWCADQHIPSHKADKTTPAQASCCPVCRKKVRQKVTIYRG